MQVDEIKKFMKDGLITRKVLLQAADVSAPTLRKKLRQNDFKDNEITYLKVLYWPLFKRLYPEYTNSLFDSLADRPVEDKSFAE